MSRPAEQTEMAAQAVAELYRETQELLGSLGEETDIARLVRGIQVAEAAESLGLAIMKLRDALREFRAETREHADA